MTQAQDGKDTASAARSAYRAALARHHVSRVVDNVSELSPLLPHLRQADLNEVWRRTQDMWIHVAAPPSTFKGNLRVFSMGPEDSVDGAYRHCRSISQSISSNYEVLSRWSTRYADDAQQTALQWDALLISPFEAAVLGYFTKAGSISLAYVVGCTDIWFDRVLRYLRDDTQMHQPAVTVLNSATRGGLVTQPWLLREAVAGVRESKQLQVIHCGVCGGRVVASDGRGNVTCLACGAASSVGFTTWSCALPPRLHDTFRVRLQKNPMRAVKYDHLRWAHSGDFPYEPPAVQGRQARAIILE